MSDPQTVPELLKYLRGIGQYDTKIRMASGVNTINITGTQGQSPDDVPDQTSPSPWDDEFEGTSLDTAGTRRTGAKPWTAINSANVVQANGRSVIIAPPGFAGTMRIIYQDVPASTPWKFRTKVRITWIEEKGNYTQAGMIALNSSNHWSAVSMGSHGGGGYPGQGLFNCHSNDTALSGNYYIGYWQAHHMFEDVYFEMENDGTNLFIRSSFSGVEGTFLDTGSNTLASHLTTVNRIGLYAGSSTNRELHLMSEWWRRLV